MVIAYQFIEAVRGARAGQRKHLPGRAESEHQLA